MAAENIHQKWIATYRSAETQGFYDLAFDEIVRRVRPDDGSTILDAGCGSAAKSVLLAARGLRVVGVDYSESALALAATTVRAHGHESTVQLKQGDLRNLPFGDGEFRYVICWGVLMHVPDISRALAELARVLVPGGMLITSEANMFSAQAMAIRGLKRVLRRGRGRTIRTPAGLECHEETQQGTLLTRQSDLRWYIEECERLGLQMRHRFAGQFTELYVVIPWRAGRRLVHAWNRFWFRYVGRPGLAAANVLIFEKSDREGFDAIRSGRA